MPRKKTLPPLEEAQHRLKLILGSIPPSAAFMHGGMVIELKLILELLNRHAAAWPEATSPSARVELQTRATDLLVAAGKREKTNQPRHRKSRCKRCNQLLRVLANGEPEPHMIPPSPGGRPGKQCVWDP